MISDGSYVRRLIVRNQRVRITVIMRRFCCVMAVPAVLFLSSCHRSEASSPQTGLFLRSFGGQRAIPSRLNPHVGYDLDPNVERYFIYVPQSYTGADRYGLIVFTNADNEMQELPVGWKSVLDARRYIFVAAQNAGNDQYRGRRLGLAVLAALKIQQQYRIDPGRVYAAGFSGGSRMAGLLGFYQSDVFRGTLQNCGADFYKAVPVVEATSLLDTAGKPYGLLDASEEEVRKAKGVAFVLITGTNDFRRGNILDIFHGGFEQDGFKAKLFDVPGMAHDISNGEILARALDFLEAGR